MEKPDIDIHSTINKAYQICELKENSDNSYWLRDVMNYLLDIQNFINYLEFDCFQMPLEKIRKK